MSFTKKIEEPKPKRKKKIVKEKIKIKSIKKEILIKGFSLMAEAKAMTELYEENMKVVSKYVHATSRGHEAIQLAVGMQLLPQDYMYPYYRDDAMLLGIGMEPYDLMLQLLAKKDDPFSGGRTYYSHPSLRDDDKPKIPHQSSATGMQAIPATGAAMGMQYKEIMGIDDQDNPLVVCSIGDAAITEGEVSEAFQMAALRQLPILYVVQDNEWDISASADEIRAQNAFEYIKGFHGIEAFSINGSSFTECYKTVEKAIEIIRTERRPILIHAKVPLLNHHTSGVRMEWYRDDLEEAKTRDPFPVFIKELKAKRITNKEIDSLEQKAKEKVQTQYNRALTAEDPQPADLFTHDFAPTQTSRENSRIFSPPSDRPNQTSRENSRIFSPQNDRPNQEPIVMVDSALFAIQELMADHKECLLYGQDVGIRLGGVFREAATLAQKFGTDRVFNTPIQEAFIIGSTVGMSAVGLKPIVEVQFADYIWPGLNQLFSEVSRSCYLSNGKWPVSMVLRVPIGAYGSGGPYHSSSVESVVANIRGIKIAYPSCAADLKGLMKAAYYDPNPVVIFEHKGLYWSKVKGTEQAKSIEPDKNYILPFGQANIVQETTAEEGMLSIITYGMGVHWALNATKDLKNEVEIVDLRTLSPLDETTVFESVRKTGKCLVVTEESINNSFARALSGLIQEECFKSLDAPVRSMGAENMPAIPLNSILEQTMIPSAEKVKEKVEELLAY